MKQFLEVSAVIRDETSTKVYLTNYEITDQGEQVIKDQRIETLEGNKTIEEVVDYERSRIEEGHDIEVIVAGDTTKVPGNFPIPTE